MRQQIGTLLFNKAQLGNTLFQISKIARTLRKVSAKMNAICVIAWESNAPMATELLTIMCSKENSARDAGLG
jgi:hypothetical protein